MRTTRALTAVLSIVALAAGGADAVAQEKPRAGGILNWFDYGDPVRLDIHAESPLVVQQATAGIYSGLLHYDPDDPSKIAGDLAERWTASPDGRPGCRQPKDQDVAEAKRLVEKHHPSGLDVEVAVRAVGNYLDRAQLVLAQLRKAGIRGTLKSHESAAGYAAFGKGDFALIATQDRAMDTADPESLFSVIYFTNAGSNYGRHSDPKVDELAERALRETSRDKRKQLYWELQRHILASPTASVPVGWVEGWFFVDKKVQGYKPALTVYDNNTFMKVWLKE